MSLVTQAIVGDVVSEFNGSYTSSGTGPFTLFNVGGITSGQIYDKITEANMSLQSWVALGSATPTSLFQTEQINRFEVCYASARLAADLIGVVITDGFNYAEGGISVQRTTAEYNTYTRFIQDHLAIAKEYIKAFNPWFYVYNSVNPEGSTNTGSPVNYWNVSKGYL